MARSSTVALAALTLLLGGCEEFIESLPYICSCDPPGWQECATDDQRCAGNVVEVCREDWCTCATWWEPAEDCTPGDGVCVEPQPGYASCVWPGPPPPAG